MSPFMLSSIRSRILVACLAIVIGSLVINTALNYFVANRYNRESISQNLSAVLTGHEAGIADWVASKTQMIVSVEDAAISPDPIPALKQIAAAGGFTNVYVGYADKTAKFSDPTGIPPDYDPTGRPWYKQAAQAGKPVVTPPYVDVGTGKLVVAFAAPIMRDGALKGVVSGDVAMDSVIANVKAIHPTPGSFGMLVDRSGHIVAHADSKLTLKPVTDLSDDLSLDALAAASADENAAPIDAHVAGAAKLMRARRAGHRLADRRRARQVRCDGRHAFAAARLDRHACRACRRRRADRRRDHGRRVSRARAHSRRDGIDRLRHGRSDAAAAR
ncbi:methyl-accepting chemotaxis protein [Burkholderia pseudomallei]|nr:methyl-accepting chemotaxis protein [Burkholderia pseudomallei]